jgi:uncharacterized protein YndB with AHSA1/START domain
VSIIVCPTDVIAAPQKRIWELLTDPTELAKWSGEKLRQGPSRPIEAGDVIVFGAGLGHQLTVTIEIQAVEPFRQLTLDVHLPLQVLNHEVVVISPLGVERSRVTFN